MAVLRPETALLVRLSALLLAGFFVSRAPLVTAQTPATKSAETVLDAASSEMDYRSNTLLFQDLLITQGSTRVKAARARSTGLDFAASSWTLSDGVRLELEGGIMTSSEATVIFRDNRVFSATIRGENTAFEQLLRNGNKASGQAREILYDATTATVVLQGEALLSDGRNDIRGDKLVYDLAAERVSAGNTAAGDRVRITIRPPTADPNSAKPPR